MDNQNNEKYIILIPSFKPDKEILSYVDKLKGHGITDIVIVDDGSGENYQHIFYDLTESGCVVLHHSENYGRGCALKTGFKYIRDNYMQFACVATVDADRQHAVEDVLRILEMSKKNPDSLSLGIRDFNGSGIPAKSLLSNRFISFMFAALYGRRLSDTQAGLRAFGMPILEFMLDLEGDRYEYEIKMLIDCIQEGIPIEMIPIQVIYENSNKGTHFKPFRDSFRIVVTLLSDFLRFSVTSIVSAVIDIGIAWFLLDYFQSFLKLEYLRILGAISIARFISIGVNYILNKNLVFQKKGTGSRSLIRYLMLCALIILLSTTGVYILRRIFGINEKIGKVFVDASLYLLSYQVQQRWVFAK